jgi:hypothetical protein
MCKYLVEDLGGDVNAPGVLNGAGGLSLTSFKISNFGRCHVHVWMSKDACTILKIFIAGATPLMISAQSGDVSMVKYFLDHGADPMKADVKGRTVLHHAVAAGCSPDTCAHTCSLLYCFI